MATRRPHQAHAVQRRAKHEAIADHEAKFARGGACQCARCKAERRDLKAHGGRAKHRADRLPREGAKSGEGRLAKALMHRSGLVIIERHRADSGAVGHYQVGGIVAELLEGGARRPRKAPAL